MLPTHAQKLSVLRPLHHDITLADLHVHTWKSLDAWGNNPRMVLQRASQRGIRFIALTDHDRVFDAESLKKLQDFANSLTPQVTIILGIEVTTSINPIITNLFRAFQVPHVLLLDVVPKLMDEFLGRFRFPFKPGPHIEVLFEWVQRQREKGNMNPLISVAHPLPTKKIYSLQDIARSTIVSSLNFDQVAHYASHLDAVEVLNGEHIEVTGLRLKLAEKLKLPGIGGSDAHELKFVGAAGTFVRGKIKDTATFLNQIRKGKAGTFYNDDPEILSDKLTP